MDAGFSEAVSAMKKSKQEAYIKKLEEQVSEEANVKKSAVIIDHKGINS